MTANENPQPQSDSADEAVEASSVPQSTPPMTTPPTERAADVPLKRESAWPTVLAVLAFVWGAFSVFSGGCMMLLSPFYGWMTAAMGDAFTDEEQAVMQRMAELWWWWLGQGVIELALAVVLIFAGIGLLQRRRRGPLLAVIWSVLVILQMLIMTPINFMLMDFPADMTVAGPQMIGQVGGYFGMVLGIVFALILPIFFLIWFVRGRIRQEVAQWPR